MKSTKPSGESLKIDWICTDDGSFTAEDPVSGDIYHSKRGALNETRFVYLNPAVEQGFFDQPRLKVLEVGFGLGLGMACFVDEALRRQVNLEFVSLEHNEALLRVDHDPNLPQFSQETQNSMTDLRSTLNFKGLGVNCQVITGEAPLTLKELVAQNDVFDVILQDPFAPQLNPECWTGEFFANLRRVTKPGGLLLTYSVARAVKDALRDQNFTVTKKPGFARKRERLEARYPGTTSRDSSS